MKKFVLIAYCLTVCLYISAQNDSNVEIKISELKYENNITTLLVNVKNLSTKKSEIVIPKSQIDSIGLNLPWDIKIMQNSIEYNSQWVPIGNKPIGRFRQ